MPTDELLGWIHRWPHDRAFFACPPPPTPPPSSLDCGFFVIAQTPRERYRALREMEERRKQAARIRDSYDRRAERAYRATSQK